MQKLTTEERDLEKNIKDIETPEEVPKIKLVEGQRPQVPTGLISPWEEGGPLGDHKGGRIGDIK